MYCVHQACVFLFYMLCGWLLLRAMDTTYNPIRSWAILGQVTPKAHPHPH